MKAHVIIGALHHMRRAICVCVCACVCVRDSDCASAFCQLTHLCILQHVACLYLYLGVLYSFVSLCLNVTVPLCSAKHVTDDASRHLDCTGTINASPVCAYVVSCIFVLFCMVLCLYMLVPSGFVKPAQNEVS